MCSVVSGLAGARQPFDYLHASCSPVLSVTYVMGGACPTNYKPGISFASPPRPNRIYSIAFHTCLHENRTRAGLASWYWRSMSAPPSLGSPTASSTLGIFQRFVPYQSKTLGLYEYLLRCHTIVYLQFYRLK